MSRFRPSSIPRLISSDCGKQNWRCEEKPHQVVDVMDSDHLECSHNWQVRTTNSSNGDIGTPRLTWLFMICSPPYGKAKLQMTVIVHHESISGTVFKREHNNE